ncbi:MAG: type II toxin-antitoxin system VapC family toxin [Lentisphaerota bacterium]
MLLDTNILIEVFKGNKEIFDALQKENDLCISSITSMELYFGALNKPETTKIQKALRAFRVVHLNQEISIKAIELVETYSKSHGLMIPDAIIAATAIIESTSLKTLNKKDFRFIKELNIC